MIDANFGFFGGGCWNWIILIIVILVLFSCFCGGGTFI
jgi:hypothetical protein